MRPRLTYANVMSSVAAFLALGGGAYAASSLVGRDGTINACVTKSGTVRVLAPGKKCAKREQALSWNQRGAQGTTGRQGLTGLAGPQGAQGVQGQEGQQGVPGTVRAFAFVGPQGCSATAGSCTVTAARNITGARRIAAGRYCVATGTGIDPLADGAMAGVDSITTVGPPGNASAMVRGGFNVCNVGQEFVVRTERIPETGAASAAASDTVGFWFAVP